MQGIDSGSRKLVRKRREPHREGRNPSQVPSQAEFLEGGVSLTLLESSVVSFTLQSGSHLR